MDITTFLTYALIIVALLLTTAILLQHRSAGLGQAFGGSSAIYHTRRGSEKRLYQSTIILGVAFLTISLLLVIL